MCFTYFYSDKRHQDIQGTPYPENAIARFLSKRTNSVKALECVDKQHDIVERQE